MRTRPREVVRMLAAFRHSAQCRSLRAAKAREVMMQANDEPDDPDEANETEDEAKQAHSETRGLPRRH